MSTKTIPLSAVQVAITGASVKARVKAREIDGKPHARVAAYTAFQPITASHCRLRPGAGYHPNQPRHFGPMYMGDLDRVVERTRMIHGPAEVKRTWGLGLRAMLAIAKSGVMR